MANVLPSEVRASVWKMYRARFVLVGSLCAIAAAGLTSLALLPSYLAVINSGAPTSSTAFDPNAEAADQATVDQTQSILTSLAQVDAASSSVSELIAEALRAKPSGVTVSGISFSRGTVDTLILSGAAPARGSVSAFRDALRADTRFSSVVVPIGDLAGSQDGHFSATLSGKF